METGPLARLLINYNRDNTLINSFVDEFLESTDLELLDLCSADGRNAARARKSAYIPENGCKLVSRLIENINYYDTDTRI